MWGAKFGSRQSSCVVGKTPFLSADSTFILPDSIPVNANPDHHPLDPSLTSESSPAALISEDNEESPIRSPNQSGCDHTRILSDTTDLWPDVDVPDPDIIVDSYTELESQTPDQETKSTGALLAEQLLRSPKCCIDCHTRYKHERNPIGLPSHGLNEVFSWPCPDVLSTTRLARSGDQLIENWPPEQREKVFCGTDAGQPSSVPAICLARGEQKLGPAAVHFDIDSVLAHITSPAVCSQGLYWYPVQRPVSDLQSDLHLDPLPVQFTDGHGHLHCVSVPLHRVKHYTFARVSGFEDASIYALFPRLHQPQQKSSQLPDDQFRVWIDDILLPAVHQYYSDARLQHFPSSFSHSNSNSWAAWAEGRSIQTQSRQQLLSYFLPPEHLDHIWQAVHQIIRVKGLDEFQGVRLFLSAKNLKLRTQSATWSGMQHRFQQLWSSTANQSYIHEVFFDIGKETCPIAPDSGQPIRGQTLLWKQCCPDKLLRSPLVQNPGKTIFYLFSFLRDTGSLTIQTRTRSHLRKTGLLYSQFYNSVKEIFAAGNQYPFSNPLLEALALDHVSYQTWQHIGKGFHDRNTLHRAYIHSKSRCATAIDASIGKSFGTREEHRVREDLLIQINQEFQRRRATQREISQRWSQRLAAQGVRNVEQDDGVVFQNPSSQPFYIHSTATILKWVRWNINRLCAGLELTNSLQRHSMVSWDRTQVMILFLRCLRWAFGGGGNRLEQSRASWQDVKEVPESNGQIQYREGIGLGTTIQRHGYGWFLNKIHWDTMGFRPAHRLHMDLHTPAGMAQFRVNYERVRKYQNDFLLLEDYFLYIIQYQRDHTASTALLSLLIDFCLRAFRKEILTVLQAGIRPEFQSIAETGQVALSKPSLQRVLKDTHWPSAILTGNRCGIRRVDHLFAWLWGLHPDEYSRLHWAHKPYRTPYRRCVVKIQEIYGEEIATSWQACLKHRFLSTHWMLPYPDQQSLFSRDKHQRYRWWSSWNEELIRNSLPACVSGCPIIPTTQYGHLPQHGWISFAQAMPLDIELPPIPGNMEAFLKMVPSKPVDLGAILPAVVTMTMGPQSGHDYRLRPSSLRNPITSSSGKMEANGPSTVPCRWADFLGQLYSKQSGPCLPQPEPHADVNSPNKQPHNGVSKNNDCTLISSFWPHFDGSSVCDHWPTIPQSWSVRPADRANFEIRASTFSNRNWGLLKGPVEYTVISGSMSIYPKGITNLWLPL
ncbi:hypothetical protein N7532_009712 [Penicillium argentinense]|uniref:Uncharacterized protein n=1 Tax=Penicillium argentinense TaxID=1131581 RepID=A0A9W9EZV8_9EURO|nr:uncharacterized protein N7532_009712 [Penicillium argentinense]KAJ5091028.1 hypothetical protein N7532_009712 [Penicillium argentinense]